MVWIVARGEPEGYPEDWELLFICTTKEIAERELYNYKERMGGQWVMAYAAEWPLITE